MLSVEAKPYDHVMLIDGNDDRGIDVAIMTRAEYDLVRIRSHVDDTDQVGQIFDRDCAEYTVATPLGNELVLLINHFKSKFGSQASSNAKRKRQAERVKAIYEDLRQRQVKFVAVIGDFNCTKSSKIDYILMSPDLFARTTRGGIFRKGVWGGKNGDLWEHYPEMETAANAASDHAAIWADIDL